MKNCMITIIIVMLCIVNINHFLAYQPVIGGSLIYTEDEDDYKTCTAGFNAYSKDKEKNYLITAAHCLEDGEIVYDESTSRIGFATDVRYDYFGGSIDIGVVEYLEDPNEVFDTNQMPYIYNNSNQIPVPVISYAKGPVPYGENVYVYSDMTNKLYQMMSIQDPKHAPGSSYLYSDYYDQSQVNLIGGVSGSPVFRLVDGGVEIIGVVNSVDGPLVYITPFTMIENDYELAII